MALKSQLVFCRPFLNLLLCLAWCNSLYAEEVPTRGLGAGYARLVSFEAEPEISAARFKVDTESPLTDDLEISTAKLPYYREFGADGEGLRWFLQATASYLNMEETLYLQVAEGFTERLEASWLGYGGLFEGGLLLSLTESFTLAPSFGLGVTRLENEMDFATPFFDDLLAPALDGVLYNWDTLATVTRASVALRYDRDQGNWRIKGSAYLSGSYVDSFDESRRFAGFSDEAGNLGLKLDLSHPTGREFRDYPIYLIGHLGYSSFVGANRDDLGFTDFGEVGISLGVQKFTLGLLGIVGEDVSGWNVQFNYDY